MVYRLIKTTICYNYFFFVAVGVFTIIDLFFVFHSIVGSVVQENAIMEIFYKNVCATQLHFHVVQTDIEVK